MISGIFRSTVWNQTIPDSMRGRLAGIEMLSYSIGPLGGQARAGLVADAWSVRGSITSGGVLCVVGVVGTALWLRDFWSYDARTDEHLRRVNVGWQRGLALSPDGRNLYGVDPNTDTVSQFSVATDGTLTPNVPEIEAVVGPCPDERTLLDKGARLLNDLQLQALLITTIVASARVFGSNDFTTQRPPVGLLT